MSIKYRFEDRGIVVTGGASGIGATLTKSFLEAGARVYVWDYDQAGLDVLAKECNSSRLTCQKVNVADIDDCLLAAEKVENLHVLINNAGITRDKTFAKLSPEDMESVVQVNLLGAMRVTKSLLPKFGEGAKRIINIASVVALYGNFGQSNYAAAKAGVIGFSKSLARELARKEYTVNVVAPGYTRTPMIATVPDNIIEDLEGKVPVGRLGETSDIANACMFLAADESSYMNGTVISVDGGLTL